MRGVDDLSGPAPGLVVAYSAAPLYIVVCGKALAHFPLAELEAVPQDVAERFSRRTACIARELFEAPLLSRTQYERTHGRKSITGLGDVAERPAHRLLALRDLQINKEPVVLANRRTIVEFAAQQEAPADVFGARVRRGRRPDVL